MRKDSSLILTKIRAIQDMPAPEDKAVLQRFTGLLQYLSKFIPNLSDVSAPLRKLEGNVEWQWGVTATTEFGQIKNSGQPSTSTKVL